MWMTRWFNSSNEYYLSLCINRFRCNTLEAFILDNYLQYTDEYLSSAHIFERHRNSISVKCHVPWEVRWIISRQTWSGSIISKSQLFSWSVHVLSLAFAPHSDLFLKTEHEMVDGKQTKTLWYLYFVSDWWQKVSFMWGNDRKKWDGMR